VESALIESEPNAWVSFTRQDRPSAASHAAKVRRVGIINRDLVRVNRASARVRMPASRNKRIIKKCCRWFAKLK
jgi:hypothetical protein